MKRFYRLIVFLLLLTGSLSSVSAQSAFEAGVRVFGDQFAIDATFPLASSPRLHTAFYIEHDFVLGTYIDWLFLLEGGPKGLRFFPGIGPEFYFLDEFQLGIAGNFGIEYVFKFPLTLGVDYRPGFLITDNFKSYTTNWGITARFRFVKA